MLGIKEAQYSIPVDQHLFQDWRLFSWKGPTHYIPSGKRWMEYHNHSTLPVKPQLGTSCHIQRDEVEYLQSQPPRGIRCPQIGTRPSQGQRQAEFGFRTAVPNTVSKVAIEELWPKTDGGELCWGRVPRHVRYGIYHEHLNRAADKRCRHFPEALRTNASERPGYKDLPSESFLFGKTGVPHEMAEPSRCLYFNTFPTGVYRTVAQPY